MNGQVLNKPQMRLLQKFLEVPFIKSRQIYKSTVDKVYIKVYLSGFAKTWLQKSLFYTL